MSEETKEPQTDFAVAENEPLFASASDDDNEAREEGLLIPEFVGVEQEEMGEGSVEETPVAPQAQDITEEPPDVEQEDDVQTEQQEEAVVAAQNEQAVEAEALPEEPKEEVEEQHQDKQEDDWENLSSDFVERRDSNFMRDVESDIVSQVSEFSRLPLPEQESETSRRRRSSVKHDRRISGDFKVAAKASSFTLDTLLSEVEKDSIESEWSEKEVIEEAEPEVFDREAYYEKYEELAADIITLKIRNNFFHKKLAEYFKKRKMEHVLKETDQQVDTQKKYCKRLDDLWELLQLDRTRRFVINTEVNELTKERDEKAKAINKMSKELLDKEKEIGTGLIHTKTGKEIPEKVIERLLRRQHCTMEQNAKQHLKYIKIRNRVAEKQAAIQQVDILGVNLRLVDYEQLKVEYRGYADKVEDREDELTKLRRKCDGIFQTLAHLREKSASAALDIINEYNVQRSFEMEYMEARERKNYFKVERDRYRNLINRLREETGILLRPRMLQDMEYAVNEIEIISKILNKDTEKKETQQTQLRAIRKNMEIATNYRMLREIERLSPAVSRASGLRKGRPSLLQMKKSE